jgi:hypothetical protein
MVSFFSTQLKTLSASSAGGPSAAATGPMAFVGIASGQGRSLVLEKSAWTHQSHICT